MRKLADRFRNRKVKRAIKKALRERKLASPELRPVNSRTWSPVPAQRKKGLSARMRKLAAPELAPLSAPAQAAYYAGNIGVDHYGVLITEARSLIQQHTRPLAQREAARWFGKRRRSKR